MLVFKNDTLMFKKGKKYIKLNNINSIKKI